MDKKEEIQHLYYDQQKNLTEVAKIVGVSQPYVSKIIRQDSRYQTEKENRKNANSLKRREKNKVFMHEKRKTKSTVDLAYIAMINQHKQATNELSRGGVLNNQAIRKWCSSMYDWNNKKGRFEFNKNFTKSNDLPDYIRV